MAVHSSRGGSRRPTKTRVLDWAEIHERILRESQDPKRTVWETDDIRSLLGLPAIDSSTVTPAVQARTAVLSELTQWLRNLLALIGLLTVMYLLTFETSSRGSLELSTGKESPTPHSGNREVTATSSGVVILPIDKQ